MSGLVKPQKDSQHSHFYNKGGAMDHLDDTSVAAEIVPRRNILSRFAKGALLAAAALSFHKVFALGKGIGQGKKVKPFGTKEVTSEQPLLGQIIPWPINYAPTGWALCWGQTLAIQQYAALFALLGTTYGGDGIRTFNLPDLRGRMPVHVGTDNFLGQTSGEETHTLILNEIPSHTHSVKATNSAGTSNAPLNNVPAVSSEGVRQYASSTNQTMEADAVSIAGGSQAHDNMPPYLVLNYIIALGGVFPSRG